MVTSCSAYGCSNRHRKNIKLQFHKFPLHNPELLSQWVKAVKRASWQPTKHSRLCSDHFPPESYKTDTKHLLKDDAVPSIFNFPNFLKQNGKKKRIITDHFLPEIIGRKCFVPGCFVRYVDERKKIEMQGVKISVFSLPRNPKLLEQWKKALGVQELAKNFRVCERHFQNEDVVKFCVSKDGSTKVRKRRPTLKFGAVPSIFPTVSSSYAVVKPQKESLKRNSASVIDKDIHMKEQEIASSLEDSFTYNKLLENLHLVKKPNNLWSITSIDDCIICAKWSEKCLVDKKIIIGNNLKAKARKRSFSKAFNIGQLVNGVVQNADKVC